VAIPEFTEYITKIFTNWQWLNHNNSLKSRYKERRCFVIGNGSSLNTQDISLLKNEVTICANSFFHNIVLNCWQPTFYCVIDPIHFKKPFATTFFTNLTGRVHETTFVLPLIEKEMVDTIGVLSGYNKNYVLFYPSVLKKSLSESQVGSVDLTGPIPGIQSVSQMGIMLAIYLGCNPVYLIGMDHDWLKYFQPGVEYPRHFYENKDAEDHAKNYTHSEELTYKGNLINMLKLWEGYEHLREYANNNNVTIINATNGGYLDVFERVKYESLFEQGGK
jgi:hypothetical protein